MDDLPTLRCRDAPGHGMGERDPEAPYVWLVNPVAVAFVSERVGNYQYSQEWGSLLDQLWVQ